MSSYTFKNSLLILFCFFPISILVGNLIININILLISSIFIIGLLTKKTDIKNQKTNFLIIFFFFLSLLINLFFSNNVSLSYPRVMKIFFVIFFILSFGYILKNLDEKKIQTIYKSWSIIFLFVTLDLIFEYYSGKNILGFASVFPGKRLGSFTGSESVIGNYYLGFCLLTLSYVKLHLKLNNFNLFLALLFIIISFFIGERANFIRTFMIISFYSFMLYDTKLRYKLIGITTVILILIIFLNLNKNYKTRYYNEIGLVFQKGISSYLKESNYGAHRNVAIEIFKDNPYFGVGIKNFRVESGSEKYDNLDHKQNYLRVSTHPHELYHEFLSENGLFGLISFIIFISLSLYFSIKNYLINRNIFQLSSILFICSSILPVLPAGSFLSTFNSSIFWINYAIMMSYNLKKIKS